MEQIVTNQCFLYKNDNIVSTATSQITIGCNPPQPIPCQGIMLLANYVCCNGTMYYQLKIINNDNMKHSICISPQIENVYSSSNYVIYYECGKTVISFTCFDDITFLFKANPYINYQIGFI